MCIKHFSFYAFITRKFPISLHLHTYIARCNLYRLGKFNGPFIFNCGPAHLNIDAWQPYLLKIWHRTHIGHSVAPTKKQIRLLTFAKKPFEEFNNDRFLMINRPEFSHKSLLTNEIEINLGIFSYP